MVRPVLITAEVWSRSLDGDEERVLRGYKREQKIENAVMDRPTWRLAERQEKK